MLNPVEDPLLRKDNAPTQGAMNYALTIPTIGSGSPSTALASVAAGGLTLGNDAGQTAKFITGQGGKAPDSSGNGFFDGKTAYTVNPTSQPGIQKVTAAGKNPLITNIRPEDAVSGLNNQTVPGETQEGIARFQRANDIRQSMIDAQPVGGVAILRDQNAEWNTAFDKRREVENISDMMKRSGSRSEKAAYGQALSQIISGQNQLAVETMRNQNQMAADQGRNAVAMRGQDLNYATTVAQHGLTARGQDLNAARDDQRIGIERSRLSLAEADQARAGEKFALDKRIAEGQIVDSESVRAARTELSAALASGDPAKVAIAREKAIAAGVKLEKPNNEFTAVTNQMGGTTILNKDTGAGAIYNIEGKKVVDIAAPRGATSPQQEYQAAIAAAAGDQKKIEAINARAKQMGVIQ